MSKRTSPPLEATSRIALINGTAAVVPRPPSTENAEFICIKERHGTRLLRLALISQVVFDQGQVGGPWFVRCDGQQLPVSAENAEMIMRALGVKMTD